MKKLLSIIVLSLILSGNAYSDSSVFPEENKLYKCTAFAGGEGVVELNFSKVKKIPFKIENLSKKYNEMYVVEHKTEVLGIKLQTLHYAFSTSGQTYFFILNGEFKELIIQVLIKDTNWKYFEIFLNLNDSVFNKVKKHSDRFGYDVKDYEKIVSLEDAKFDKEISILQELYNFTVDIHQTGEVSKYMTSQTAYNCN